jgi:hypothetical protein
MNVLLRAWPNEEGEIKGGYEIIVPLEGPLLTSGDFYTILGLPRKVQLPTLWGLPQQKPSSIRQTRYILC